MTRFTAILLPVFLIAFFLHAEEKRAITFEDFFSMKRITTLKISPDGSMLAFNLKVPDIVDNSYKTDIWLLDLETAETRQFTDAEASSSGPAWSPDGKWIYFNRSGQIWRKPLAEGGAELVTDFVAGSSSPVLHPDGKHLLFKADVYAGCETVDCLEERFEQAENRRSSGRVIDNLLYRHWNSWREGKHSHVFLARTDGEIVRDVTPGPYDGPPLSLGSGHDYTFSPDGEEICFVRNTDEIVAASTNNDLFFTGLEKNNIRRFTTNEGNDNLPLYSPDGRYIAYRSMERAGFEADRYRIMLYDRDEKLTRDLTEGFTLSAASLLWHPGGESIFFTAEEEGFISIYSVDIRTSKINPVLKGHYVHDVQFVSPREIVFRKQTASMPDEVFRMHLKTRKPVQVTSFNSELLAELEMPDIEPFWFTGAKGEKVHGFLLKPPFFDPEKSYPAIELIHGGPQGAWGDDFHYRWNYQMFASPGYVVFMINFHGSSGYGQDFKDAVSKDWGGAPYEDIVKGTEYVLENYPFIDRDRLAAAGASYGGFMINWILGHENPFQCLVSHDGVYDQVSMYGATEELWFPEWEFNGVPWEEGSLYDKWSPSRLADAFRTPTLVIHGEHDYRVPYTQGLQLFTALQRQGVESRLLFFPDEDHFVQKPQNAKQWWNTVHGWIGKFTEKK